MEIGTRQREIIVEPLEMPQPLQQPTPERQPDEIMDPIAEPELVPVGVPA